MTALLRLPWLHPLLLLVWLVIGILLRLTNLTAKPPWTDEFSTLVFSLGNSFLPVPLDQPISVDVLLQPLQPITATGIKDVWTHLITESNHPPLYFVLAHWWMQLFPTEGGLVSLWGARSLAALFGGASIPAIYALSWLAFRSRLVSQLAAAMMATSPYSIFLAQEARHYSLAILWVIASLACLVIATRHIQNRTQLPIWVVLSWVGINALGIATHYFFTLTLCAEAFVLIVLGWRRRGDKGRGNSGYSGIRGQGRERESKRVGELEENSSTSPIPTPPFFSPWLRIYAVAVGTSVAGLVWLPVFLHSKNGGQLTEWIQGPRVGMAWLNPLFQAFGAWLTMIYLLPVEASQLSIIIASGLVMLAFLIWGSPILVSGLRVQLNQPQNRLMTQILSWFIIGAIALFFIFTYFFNIDLTRGARYNFVYFPAVIVLVGASLAVCWNFKGSSRRWGISGKKSVAIIWLMGLLSAITVICNLGYQKYYRPDLFVQLIQQTSHVPVLISTIQKTHVQIGEMMGVAREFKIHNSTFPSPKFLLLHQGKNLSSSTTALQDNLKLLPRPLDLWLVNFYTKMPTEVKNCTADTHSLPAVNGYEYKLYHCLEK
ncbi:MAG: phospholipid carrier-dependent glycosyltransferase [Rhizonema sp. PD38]|nr:phospholipid carrier-dependent glycosyltransferase [Rhizonema sp. PD38]